MNSENMSVSPSLSDVEKMAAVLSSNTRFIEVPVTSHILTLPLACLEGERGGEGGEREGGERGRREGRERGRGGERGRRWRGREGGEGGGGEERGKGEIE